MTQQLMEQKAQGSQSSVTVGGARRTNIWSYLLILPAIGVVGTILGYPIFNLFQLSFQKYGIEQLLFGAAERNGLENYRSILADPEFWTVLRRTLFFTAYAVTGTIVLGAILAHSLLRMSATMRFVINGVLIVVWAMPQLVAISVWRWMFSFDFSVITGFMQQLGFDFEQRNWFVNPITGFGIIGLVVIWGAIPFVTITLYAALAQIPRDFIEAAQLDGANRFQIFRYVLFPILRPVYVILITLSIIWDFQVFAHIWVMLEFRPDPSYYTMAVYAFQTSFGISEYGRGSAVAILMIVVLIGATSYYLRRMLKESEES